MKRLGYFRLSVRNTRRGNSDHLNGDDMYEMNADGSGLVQIAHGFSEPSGLFDVSEWAGYRPGSVLLTSIQSGGSSGAQLSVLISPGAVVPEPISDGLLVVGGAVVVLLLDRRRRSS